MDIPRTGPELKDLFRFWGITQASVAEELGIGQQLLSHIVHGRASLLDDQAAQIERIVNSRAAERNATLG